MADLGQVIRPDAVDQLVFPIVPTLRDGVFVAVDHHRLDAGRTEFDADDRPSPPQLTCSHPFRSSPFSINRIDEILLEENVDGYMHIGFRGLLEHHLFVQLVHPGVPLVRRALADDAVDASVFQRLAVLWNEIIADQHDVLFFASGDQIGGDGAGDGRGDENARMS
jgi:hypothetical protein